ncbi:hypothetical protein BH09MYX1_BH09MYX1_19380 [soil metagenome]
MKSLPAVAALAPMLFGLVVSCDAPIESRSTPSIVEAS